VPKKPYNIIRDFILRYTNKDEIVIDPFCGSGISITESVFTGRKAIGIDINPAAIFITRQMINKIPMKLIREEFSKLESEIKGVINSFYVIERGNKKFIGTHFIWENGKLTEVWYKNDIKARTKVIEKPTEDDLELALSFSYNKIPYDYPKGGSEMKMENKNRKEYVYIGNNNRTIHFQNQVFTPDFRSSYAYFLFSRLRYNTLQGK
jgi:DNA methylase.